MSVTPFCVNIAWVSLNAIVLSPEPSDFATRFSALAGMMTSRSPPLAPALLSTNAQRSIVTRCGAVPKLSRP